MELERNLQPFTPHFDFRPTRGLPLWSTHPFDGYYHYSSAIKVIGNTVYGIETHDVESLESQGKTASLYTPHPVNIPKQHELLGVTFVYNTPNEVGVFHTDGSSVYATFRDFNNSEQKTFNLGSFKKVKKFNTGVVLQQKRGSWLIIPPQIPEIVSRTYAASRDTQQFKDSLREKAIVWRPDAGEPIYIKFHHRKANSYTPLGLIVTADRRLYIIGVTVSSRSPYVDLLPFTKHLSDEEFKRKLNDGVGLAHSRNNRSGHRSTIAFQFDGTVYKFNFTSGGAQNVEVVSKVGHLIDSVDSLLLQKGDTISDLVDGVNYKLKTTEKILWSQRFVYGSTTQLMSGEHGNFYLMSPEGIKGDSDELKYLPEFKRNLVGGILSPMIDVTKDTVLQLLKRAPSWFDMLGVCQ